MVNGLTNSCRQSSPLRSAMSRPLKRKFEEVDEDPAYSSPSPSSLSSSAFSEWESDGDSCYSDTLDSRPSCPSSPAPGLPAPSILKTGKRARRPGLDGVTFDSVTVFLFPRCQGFTSVPSRGGCTLGMERRHCALRRYTLAQFGLEQRRLRREKLRQRLRQEKLEALRMKLTCNGTRESEEAERLTEDDVPEDEVDVSGVDLDDGSFLHPYPSKQRHALLRAAGVKKVDREEKRQLQQIRLSREDCGCDCQGFCEPETCACSLAGIKCQMDHSSFPCGCTKDGCGNTEGRVEFNSGRVQTHYIHTIMKLELEKRLEEEEEEEEEGEEPEEEAPPPTPSFHFSSQLASAGEGSCCSDSASDSSVSSGHSEDAEPRPLATAAATLDVDDDGLARILSLSAHESEDGDPGAREASPAPDDAPSPSISSYLDENANQAAALFQGFPNTPSPSLDPSARSYTDLSLSSDSDLEFFGSFPDYGPSPLYGSLKDYDHLDNYFHFQLPSYPSLALSSGETGTCFLESLIGLSESVPEPPATFTDNQLLEEAIKS